MNKNICHSANIYLMTFMDTMRYREIGGWVIVIAEIVRTENPCDVWAGREREERETIRLISDLLWRAFPYPGQRPVFDGGQITLHSPIT